jgi:hypothetical protein
MGTTQAVVARLESGETMPSTSTMSASPRRPYPFADSVRSTNSPPLLPQPTNESFSVFQISSCSLVSNLYLLVLFVFARKGPDISLRFRPWKWHVL